MSIKRNQFELAIKLLEELRIEIQNNKRYKNQMFGFKILFISAVLGLILANLDQVDIGLIIIPALASFYFDFVIAGYSYAIKRAGAYVRCFLEPILKESSNWPNEALLWEEFLTKYKFWQTFSKQGTIGLSFLLSLITLIAFYLSNWPPFILFFLILTLACLNIYNFIVFYVHLDEISKVTIDSLKKKEKEKTKGKTRRIQSLFKEFIKELSSIIRS